jgi:hypothetical protein
MKNDIKHKRQFKKGQIIKYIHGGNHIIYFILIKRVLNRYERKMTEVKPATCRFFEDVDEWECVEFREFAPGVSYSTYYFNDRDIIL